MKTEIAIARAGGRDKLAQLCGVATITTYHWQQVLPRKHERYLRAIKPKWFEGLELDVLAVPPLEMLSSGAG